MNRKQAIENAFDGFCFKHGIGSADEHGFRRLRNQKQWEALYQHIFNVMSACDVPPQERMFCADLRGEELGSPSLLVKVWDDGSVSRSWGSP